MYKVQNEYFNGQIVGKIILRYDTNGSITSFVTNPNNTDYANFKRHLQGLDENGNSITPAELQDADGNTMSPEEVAEFVATLP